MEQLRAGFRLIIFLFLTVTVLTLFAIGLLVCMGNNKRQIRWKNWIMSHWASWIARLIGCRIDVFGIPPEPPFFLVCNHLSYADILPFWKHLNTTFIAKSEIKHWPLFGQGAQLLGIIFINRNKRRDLSRVNRIIKQRLNEQDGIILFAEGTSSKGAHVLPFKSSLLYYPAREQLPVHFASISYSIISDTSKEAWRNICWWGDKEFFSHFWSLLKIKSWRVTVHFGEEAIANQNRKGLTQMLHQKVSQNFIPTFTQKA